MAKYIAKTQMKNEAGELFDAGDVVELGAELAKKFRANGLLETYVPEDEPAPEPAEVQQELALPETFVPLAEAPVAEGDPALTDEEKAVLAAALKSPAKK